MAKAKTAKPINLALQGGGNHGAFTWGVLDYLLEERLFRIDGVSATSAGAMNAVALASGWAQDGYDGARACLERFWKEVCASGSLTRPFEGTPMDLWVEMMGGEGGLAFTLFDVVSRLVSPYDFNPFNFNPLRQILEASVDFEALRACDDIRLFISATHVATGTVKIFNNAEVTPDVVMASACLPYLMQAVKIDGEAFWDGGFMGNPALFPIFYECDCADTLIVHINPLVRPNEPRSASDILNRVNEITFNAALLKEFRAIAFVQHLLAQGMIKDEYRDLLKDVRLHSLRADELTCELSVASKFRTDWAFLSKLKAEGRKTAAAWARENAELVGVRSSVDIQKNFLDLGKRPVRPTTEGVAPAEPV